jgi:hypothetical protein
VVIDITSFRLAEGTSEERFLERDEQVRTGTLYQRRGMLRATTARDDDGGWAVILVWWSEEAADRDALAPLLELADPGSVEHRRLHTFD